jgi:hypothetical protein
MNLEYDGLLVCNAVLSVRSLPTFHRCLQPSSSGSRWRQQAPLKCGWTRTTLHSTTTQKAAIFILTAVRTSNLTCSHLLNVLLEVHVELGTWITLNVCEEASLKHVLLWWVRRLIQHFSVALLLSQHTLPLPLQCSVASRAGICHVF